MNPFIWGYFAGVLTLLVVVPLLAPYFMKYLVKRKASSLIADNVNMKLDLFNMDTYTDEDVKKENIERGPKGEANRNK